MIRFKGKTALLAAMVLMWLGFSCTKEEVPGDVVPNNNPPYYGGVASVLLQNYVNRLYIDLIGREPLDVEMETEVATLKSTNAALETRETLIVLLQEDETFRVGDSSYKAAYYNRLYELFKVRMLEGASDGDIERERGLIYGQLIYDSIAQDWYSLAIHMEMIEKLDLVMAIDEDLASGEIEIRDAFARLLDNAVYDRINMNTFNFIRASFNDLFGRYPTQAEFDAAFDIIEFDKAGFIFGKAAANKGEYIEILVDSKEFYEGMVRWTYGTLLARDPSLYETEKAMQSFYFSHDLPKLQKSILVTNEYANF